MKKFIKYSASLIVRICILPFLLSYKIKSLFIGEDRAFALLSQTFSILPGLIGEYARKEIYGLTLNECASDCTISFGTIFSHSDCSIKEGVYIGANCMIGKVDIGKNVLVGSNVDILSGKHQHSTEIADVPIRFQRGEFKKISIGEDTWIGNHSVVMDNIGKGCVIGAGSVVTQAVEDYSIVGGNPARIIGKRG
jgi:acetyltransferase-like isoleucine patch superfamily enzyme